MCRFFPLETELRKADFRNPNTYSTSFALSVRGDAESSVDFTLDLAGMFLPRASHAQPDVTELASPGD